MQLYYFKYNFEKRKNRIRRKPMEKDVGEAKRRIGGSKEEVGGPCIDRSRRINRRIRSKGRSKMRSKSTINTSLIAVVYGRRKERLVSAVCVCMKSLLYYFA